MPFSLEGRTALVTGANRGLGRVLVEQLLERGAAKVYAGARQPDAAAVPGAEMIGLDLTDSAQIAAAAQHASDVDLIINNAGIDTHTDLVSGDLQMIQLELNTNFYGPLSVVRAFAPVLAANGGGAIVNILSALSWFAYDGEGAYAATKAAAWSLTNSIRLELSSQGTQVTAVHAGVIETDMMPDGYPGPTTTPQDAARTALDGVQAGELEVLIDEWSRMIKGTLAGNPREFYTTAV
jgi:NAD(P)-dependent dehydrogenase (short-subunit alcohol dehydrogenase family)